MSIIKFYFQYNFYDNSADKSLIFFFFQNNNDVELRESDDDNTEPVEDAERGQLWNKILFTLLFPLALWHSVYCLSDAAGTVLLKILSAFLRLDASSVDNDGLSQVADKFPLMKGLLNKVDVSSNNYTIFSVCPTCHSLYPIDTINKSPELTCSFVPFPNHKYQSTRKSCNTLLFKRVICKKNSNNTVKST